MEREPRAGDLPMMPAGAAQWVRHAHTDPGPCPPGALDGASGRGCQLVVSRVSSLIFHPPSTSTTVTRTVWVQDCAPPGVTRHSDPSGAG
jgi:hypothetical protein